MKVFLPALLAVTLLSSCGYVSKSTLHSAAQQRPAENSESQELPSVEIKQGERTLAYKQRIGFPPLPGGYVASLLALDESIVKTELIEQGRGHNSYLTGLKPGTTKVYLVNGLISEKYNRSNLRKIPPYYSLTVTP